MEFLDFLVLGLGTGALYVIASLGLIVVYRGTGVINFAHGAIGMVGAYLFWILHANHGVSFTVSFLASLAACAGIGAFTHQFLMRPLRHPSPVAKLLISLGLLITLESLVSLKYPQMTVVLSSSLPTARIDMSGIVFGEENLFLIGMAVLFSLALWLLYRYTKFGLITSAVAHDPKIAASLGHSVNAIATINWMIGSMLAGVAAIFIAPLTGLQVTQLTELVIPALAIAIVGGLVSFPIALIAGLALGVAQSEIGNYVSYPGIVTALPFVFIILFLVVRGSSLPRRLDQSISLPRVGRPHSSPISIVLYTVIAIALTLILPLTWVGAITTTLVFGIILLSIVVVTGYAGQISLAQFALAGIGAYVAGRLAAIEHWPFLACVAAGVVVAFVAGVVIGLPSLRTRGVTLSIVTLAFAAGIEALLFDSYSLTGGNNGTYVGAPKLFGLNMSSVTHPRSYAIMCLVAFVCVALGMSKLRGSSMGRRFLAVRGNERAAAALGVNASSTKLVAFAVSGAIAALGGILLVFQVPYVVYSNFQALDSVNLLGLAIVGGVGYPSGSLFGAQLQPGAIGTSIGNAIFGAGFAEYLTLATGVLFLFMLIQAPHGLADLVRSQGQWLRRFFKSKVRKTRKQAPTSLRPSASAVVKKGTSTETHPEVTSVTVERKSLTIESVRVMFGTNVALDGVSLRVLPGTVVGLIGPNGAGKTTLIEAVSGFVSLRDGNVTVDDLSLNGLSPPRRRQLGISRSFQSLELFDDMTVLENLQVAVESIKRESHTQKHSAWLAAIIELFELHDDLDRLPTELSFGRRRLVAVARSVAGAPSILMLDEPVSGLTDSEALEFADLVTRLVREFGLSVLLVEHNVDFVMRVCDRIVVLNFGKVIAEGTPNQVSENPSVREAYLGKSDTASTNDEGLSYG